MWTSEELPYIFLWTQDGEVWAVVLTFIVGLSGALVGGFFATATAKRARKYQLEDIRRTSVEKDIRELHEMFVDLVAAIDKQPQSFAQAIGADSWLGEWKEIWTPELRSNLRVRANLIPLPAMRIQVNELIRFLNSARDHSADGIWPGAPQRDLRRLAGLLAAEGVEVLAAYIRQDDYDPGWVPLRAALVTEEKEYEAWEKHLESSSEARSKEQWDQMTDEEKKDTEEWVELFFARRRAASRRASPDSIAE